MDGRRIRVLHLLSSLDYGGTTTQALMLARGLAGSCDLRVCAIEQKGPCAVPLREAGVAVLSCDWKTTFDLKALWRLRCFLHDFEPERVHVWRMPALRALALAGRKFLSRCIVSQALPTDHWPPRLGNLDRWILGYAARVVAGGAAEAQCLQDCGIRPEKIVVILPGVDIPAREEHASSNMTSEPLGRSVLCMGNVASQKGFRTALRAADYLAYVFAELRLQVVGAGPYLPTIERYLDGVFHRDRMHLLGARADASTYVASAAVCWVPSLTMTGAHFALEAMAAGVPVIASDLPHLRELITDGESGFLVPPGHAIALARRTRDVLLDQDLARRLGETARQRAHRMFSSAQFVRSWRQLYGLPSSRSLERIAVSGGDRVFDTPPADFSVAMDGLPRNNEAGICTFY